MTDEPKTRPSGANLRELAAELEGDTDPSWGGHA